MYKWRVTFIESERGWGSNYETHDYATEEEANTVWRDCQAKPGPTPDYYYISTGRVERVYVGKHSA